MKFALMHCFDLVYLVGISDFLDGKLLQLKKMAYYSFKKKSNKTFLHASKE